MSLIIRWFINALALMLVAYLYSGVQVTGIAFDGGYADYMIAPVTALATVPAELDSVAAAPLMCAGLTTFNALRNSGASGGDLVAVLGLGGLGHLGVQYAAKMGFRTAAIARGQDKETLARRIIRELRNPDPDCGSEPDEPTGT